MFLCVLTGEGVLWWGPAGAGVWVPVRDLHAGVHLLPSRPGEDREAAGRRDAGGGSGRGRRSVRVQELQECGDWNRTGSQSGSVSPSSQETQCVINLQRQAKMRLQTFSFCKRFPGKYFNHAGIDWWCLLGIQSRIYLILLCHRALALSKNWCTETYCWCDVISLHGQSNLFNTHQLTHV